MEVILRSLVSEGQLTYQYTGFEGKEKVTKMQKLEGPTSLLTTTIRGKLEEQLEDSPLLPAGDELHQRLGHRGLFGLFAADLEGLAPVGGAYPLREMEDPVVAEQAATAIGAEEVGELAAAELAILGIGVDDMFVLAATYSTLARDDTTPSEKVCII